MPIPKPNINESKEEFLDRCMIDSTMVAEYDDKQRFAICESQLETPTDEEEIKIIEVNTMENIKKRHIIEIKEDEKTITLVYSKDPDAVTEAESEEVVEVDEVQEEEIDRDHIEGHESDEEEILEEIDEEVEDELEEDPQNTYSRSMEKVDVWDKKHTQEKRFFEIETRIDKKEGRDVVVGHAAVFNSLSEDLGGFREKIMPNAFDDVLDNDVRAYFNHDPNYLLGRVSAGTLRLSVDEKGLKYELDIPKTTAGRDLKENLKNGNITQSSFAFTLGKDGDTWERSEDGSDLRIINKVDRLYDVSPVSLPAYPSSYNLSLVLSSNCMDKENKKKEDEKNFELNTLLNLKINLLKIKK